MRQLVRLALLGMLVAPTFAHAWGLGFDRDFDEQKKPWKELQTQLPPYPKDENQQAFYVSGIAGNHYFVDKTTLDMGKDGVVRYVLTIKTRGGATNVGFEGIRCATRERKIYAIGHTDGSWSRARDSKWQPIASTSQLSYHRALADEYLCPQGEMARSPQQVLKNMRADW
ncbi:MAG TPA: CNP1-like family protein [Sulfuriferula sp.]|nr:CNP1-like family protein [Sulfuriferula sp.]